MKGEISCRDQSSVCIPGCKPVYSAVKLDFLTSKSTLIDSRQETASSGHYRNCTLWHFYTGLTFESLWRPVAQFPEPDVKILSQNYAVSFFYTHQPRSTNNL